MRRRVAGAARRARDAMAGLAAAAFVAAGAGLRSAQAVTLGELAEETSTMIQDVMGLAQWVFYALAVFVSGWAILRFKAHVENPQRGGLAMPVVGIMVAVALAGAPALIDSIVEGTGLDRDPGLQRPRFIPPTTTTQ